MTRFVLLPVMAAWAMLGAGALRAGANVWTSLGPQGGTVTAIAIDPQNSGAVYAASGARLFKSGNSGASWSALDPGPPCCIATLMIDPQTQSTLYAVTLDGNVFKSTDGGTNWSPVNSGLPVDAGGRYGITSLAIDPQNPTTIYAGNALRGGGVFKTTDGGESWNAANSGLPDGGVIALAINPQDPDTIYASTRGVFKSTDGGASWSAVNSGLESDIGNLGHPFSALAIDPQNPDTIYAAGFDTALYKTTDGGARWTVVGYELLFGYGRQADSVIAVAIDPRDSTKVYAGTSAGAFKSTDAGISWSAVKSRLITDTSGPLVISALAIDPRNPDTVYAIESDTRVFKTADAGASWTAVYSEPTTPRGLTVLRIDPQTSGTMYAGTPVGVFKTTNDGANWSAVNAGLPNDGNGHVYICTLAIDPQTPSTLYALYAVTSADVGFWVGGGVFKSTDGGVNWTRLNTGGQESNFYDLTRGLAIDPQNPSIVYVGNGYGVIKTTDGGASWRWVNSGFPVSPNFVLPNQNVAVTTLAIDPRNPGTVYAGVFGYSLTGSALFKTTNGGEAAFPRSWTSAGLTGFRYAEILAIDRQNPSTIYARAVIAESGLLFKSTNGGASWTAVNSGLPNNVTALAIDPRNSSTVYAGTGSGVFRSTDGGTNWVAANSGLTNLNVQVLLIDPRNPDTVYAGTHNGSVFAMTFAPEP
ncbi:MAG TPA: hypothetical protein VL285_23350 [Bryobacteraceae bacterium]|jgi:photosystem II stability/assembly factor-like uncharacterized protein|nr:hypothetical protein [Bryobacteraceae bacterium]